jgi:ABC-2 type transport system ATP-binding protein
VASARDDVVTSFDGTPIVVHLYDAATLPAGGRAPTVLVSPPYPTPGETRADLDVGDRIGLATLRAAGYNVVTFDPRGIGGSGGMIMFDSPAFEGRDARAIIDWVAAQPEVQLDAPGDPRLGMTGTSYGAAIQLLSAAVDPRIDALVPDLGWHSLITSLDRDGDVKTGWLAPLCGLDVLAGAVDGRATVADVRPVTAGSALKTACVEGVAGALSGASTTWLADHGPGTLVKQIRAPTLLMQGTTDTLFPLDEAIVNYAALRANGVPVKMIWYCGGHVACPTNAGDPKVLQRAGLAWLNRWLRPDATVDTGPAFEWQSDDGAWRSGPDFPLAPTGTLDAVASGSLTLAASASPQQGLARSALPATHALQARFTAPSGSVDVVGDPHVRLTYRGRAKPARTYLYAQVVDAAGKRVEGGQATPLPVILDGRQRTVDRSLEALALRGRRGAAFRLQVAAGAADYALQRSRGHVSVYGAHASLPVVDAARSGRTAKLRTPARPATSISATRSGARARLVLRARLAGKPCGGSVTFTLRTASRPYLYDALLRPSHCQATTTVRLALPRNSDVRVSATFNGNGALAARSGRSVTYRVH